MSSPGSHNGNTISQYWHRFMLRRIAFARGNPIVIYRLPVKCGRFIGCGAAPRDDLVSLVHYDKYHLLLYDLSSELTPRSG